MKTSPPAYEAFLKLDTGTHTDCIGQLEITSDGKTLVSAGECTIRVWDLETRALRRQLLGRASERSEERYGNGNVSCFAISPDGRLLAALKSWFEPDFPGADAGRCTELQLFELASGNLRMAGMLPGLWESLSFSPDGRYLAVAGNEREARSRHAVVRLYATAALLKAGAAGLDRLPAAQGSLRLARASARDSLWQAVRFVPGPLRRGQAYRLVAAAGDPQQGRLCWLGFDALQGLRLQREERGLPALSPGTLAVSHAFAGVASQGLVKQGRRRVGLWLWRSHDAELQGQICTDAAAVSAAFSAGGCHLLLGLSMRPEAGAIKAAGDETVAVNAYAATGVGFALQSSYYGHDDDVWALCFWGETALSSGGDSHAIHFWDCRHRVGRQTAAIRGLGQTFCLPGVNAREHVLFGTVPLRQLPKGHAERQQCFDLRSLSLHTTEDSSMRVGDFESAKWLILDLGAQVMGLRHSPDAQGAELDEPPDLSLFVASNDEWVIWTRSGYYAASPDGERLMGYHVSRGPQQEALFLPADRFKAFYRPDIVRAVVRHGSEARARAAGRDIPALDVTEMLPPHLELLQTRLNGAELELRVSASWPRPAAAPTRLWLLRNGRFVVAETGTRSEYRLRLRLLPGRNELTVLAENDKARSMPLSFSVDGPEVLPGLPQQTASSGNLYLLAVGVSEFEVAGTDAAQGNRTLPYPHRDAIAIYNAFAASRRSHQRQRNAVLRNKAFDAVDASLLVDQEATKTAILRELDRLCDAILARAQAEGAERDVLFVFLAGHGVHYPGEPELYFWNYDMRPDDMERTGLSMVELGERISAVPAEVIVAIDTCHSAMTGNNLMRGLNAEAIARRVQAVNERGMYVLSAARSEEKARDSHADRQGVFTAALLGALDAASAARGSTVSMLSLMNRAQEMLPLISQKAGTKLQTPVFRMYGDLLPLTIYKT